jgi:putative redox protein
MTTQAIPTPAKRVSLRWTGSGMEYSGAAESGPAILLDGRSMKGPGPMEQLLLALAGCMAMDIQVILERSRVPMTGLEVEVVGERAQTHPKRYTSIRMIYRVEGPREEHQAKLERAVTLSREAFCSVLHSLRPDTDIITEVHRV